MFPILMTANSGKILGPIAKFLGWVMNAIYVAVYNAFGIESVVLSIVILTIIIYMCLLPLTIKQQKFSKLQQAMQPELQAIQAKYKGRKDQESQNLMQQETNLVYQKYGVSPMGSCVQLLIQMPILFALYRVFYNIPAYISSVKATFEGLASGIAATDGAVETLTQIMTDNKLTTGSGLTASNVAEKLSAVTGDDLTNYVIDILYKLPSTAWNTLTDSFPNLADEISTTHAHMLKFNYFLGMNISDTPMNIIKNGFVNGAILSAIIALMIPVLSYLTQVLSMKMMPQAATGENDAAAQQMKTMNTMMPLMSLFICFTVPVGLGIYWVMSAVVRIVQQYFINKHIKNLNLDAIIEKNQEKVQKEMEKQGIRQNQIRQAASMNTRKIDNKANKTVSAENEAKAAAATAKKANAKPGSMAAKANMVQNYNSKNNQK